MFEILPFIIDTKTLHTREWKECTKISSHKSCVIAKSLKKHKYRVKIFDINNKKILRKISITDSLTENEEKYKKEALKKLTSLSRSNNLCVKLIYSRAVRV